MKQKLFVAGMLSFLTVFQSCNSNDDLPLQDTGFGNESISETSKLSLRTLSSYVAELLSDQVEIQNILDREKNVNHSLIQSKINSITTEKELETLYRDAGVRNIKGLITLYRKIGENTKVFVEENKEFYSRYNEKERESMLIKEIDSQLGYDEQEGAFFKKDCHATYVKTSRRCMRNYAISMAGVAASGLISLGAGTVIGGAVATTMMIICNSDAETDYHSCVKEGGLP
ncbi:hypothetical protein [Chryseobacterium sp.]|uniref:hypothetical protein n=1 Tax=Chryseobacterium sp. TaxID=1871047 RepID=UPI0025B9AA18|nr:hypothetical protein [Chryseobacterium sp.]